MANYNPNLAKVNRNYTFEELATVFGVHKNTVSAWVKNGLPCLKDQRPFLIIGADTRAYLKSQRVNKKQKSKNDEFYCVRCKHPTKPADNLVEYLSLSSTKGRLTASCAKCDCTLNKFTSAEGLHEYSKIFDLLLPKELEHISDSYNPLLNSDFNK